MNSLVDVWCETEPKVCKVTPKGYRLKFEDYMPILAGETAAGIAAILGTVLYLSHKRELYDELEEFSGLEIGDFESTTAEALRRYLFSLDAKLDETTINELGLFEGGEG